MDSAKADARESSVLPMALTGAQRARYARHLSLPEVGERGQQRLLAARVLCVGAGGLGSPIAMYLAAAGVGTIGIIDSDVVDESNLQRQVIHGQSRIGVPKVFSAAAVIAELNPGVDVIAHERELTSDNALELFASYDLIVDGTDTFATRYLINDACVLLGKPFVFASVLRFGGQVMTVLPGRSACYRCAFPEPPLPGTVPTCEQAGVFGAMCGVIGSYEAVEAIKLITGVGEPLTNRMMRVDALTMNTEILAIPADPQCAVCGESPTITGLIDYPAWCGTKHTSSNDDVTALQLQGELAARDAGANDFVLIDVREPFETQICAIDGALHIPQGLLADNDDIRTIAKDTRIVVMCLGGVRSAAACEYLRGEGFLSVHNLAGGIRSWIDDVDPSLTRY